MIKKVNIEASISNRASSKENKDVDSEKIISLATLITEKQI
jgi:hypothetical protein